MQPIIRLLTLTATLAGMLLLVPCSGQAEERLRFSGGPEGGTFESFSKGIAARLSNDLPGVEVYSMASVGSVENIRRVNSGDADFGIAYSGDTYLARNGRLTKDSREYRDVHAVAYLYGTPAHLIALKGSGIDKVNDLAGKRVAVGGAGSGAASAAQRFFVALGLWDKMNVEFIGYSKAANALGDRLIDAMWIFAGFPNASVIQAAANNEIRILSTWDAGERGGAFKQYPFYAPATIPAGTYRGIEYDVHTFQESALWLAGKHVAADTVYAAAADIFSPEGLAYLTRAKSTARAMSVKGALIGIVTPVHAGAARLWTEKGLPMPPEQGGR